MSCRVSIVVRVRQHGVDAPDEVMQQLQLLLLLQVLLRLHSLLLLQLLSAAALQHCCHDVQQIFTAEAAVDRSLDFLGSFCNLRLLHSTFVDGLAPS